MNERYGDMYRNKKTGKVYIWAWRAENATNGREGEQLVLYYQENRPIVLHAREESEFNKKFEKIQEDE